jgi:YjbR
MNYQEFKELAESFDNVDEKPHFKSTSFTVGNKIFASLEIETAIACLKFSIENQLLYSQIDKAIYPVDNHWGKSGWTFINIANIRTELMLEALSSAYYEVLKTKKK